MNSERRGHPQAVRSAGRNSRTGERAIRASASRRLFDRLWYAEPDAITNAIGYAKFSRSHDAVIRVYDAAGNVIGTHEHAGDFKEP